MSAETLDRIRIGISSCLLGERVRYDGTHKLDTFLRDTLGQWVEFVPVCPEVECGLSIPREPVRLVGDPAAPRLLTVRTKVDLTDQMQEWARRRMLDLEKENLCGFIFKAKSPSSGLERVKVYTESGGIAGYGPGMFARAFMAHFPLLPVEDEGRLHDPDLRENFFDRLFTLYRYRQAIAPAPSPAGLMRFHARHKMLLMAHSPKHLREMGRLLAENAGRRAPATAAAYERLLLEALALRATVARHTNALQHMAGYLREHLPDAEREELRRLIETYRRELVPLIVPVTLLGHHARKYGIAYLTDQVYLDPHPIELKLRNHA